MKRACLTCVVSLLLLGFCLGQQSTTPSIVFTKIPHVSSGGADKLDSIEGRVIGARPGQRVVLFARSDMWYVQPFVSQPFTVIQPDSTFKRPTHLGSEYAALLVDPGFTPLPKEAQLPNPGGNVIAISIVHGIPPFWSTPWFIWACALTVFAFVLLSYYIRMQQVTHQLNLRFEERLAERTRIAQELHDTLLQGFLSASMQLHVAKEQVPADSPTRLHLDRVHQLILAVIDEGRNAVRALRPTLQESDDLEEAFAKIHREMQPETPVAFRIIVEGQSRPLHPLIRDEVYRIGREALVNAFRHSKATKIEMELESSDPHLRVMVRDNGCGIDPQILKTGRDGHWGLSGMRERADRIGASLRVWSRAEAGTEVELSVPGKIAFQTRLKSQAAIAKSALQAREAPKAKTGS
jgi:signal transduction histidine kinase